MKHFNPQEWYDLPCIESTFNCRGHLVMREYLQDRFGRRKYTGKVIVDKDPFQKKS